MAFRCELCKKKTQYGKQHTHHAGVAGGQWKKRAPKTLRTFRPNLQKTTLTIDGKSKKVRACTKCIKRVKFDLKKQKAAQAPATS